jgi:hypothetical protein
MNRFQSIVCSIVFVGLIAFPCQISAVSITETRAAIGEGCVASGHHSTAMGYGTEAEGTCSTAMGLGSVAGGDYSTAMGLYTLANETHSISMGYFTTADSSLSTVIGAGRGAWARLVNSTPNSFMVGYMADDSDTTPELFVKDGAVGIGTCAPQNLLDLGETQGKKLAVFQKPTGEDFYGFGISSATLEIYAGVTSDDTDPAMVVKKSTGRIGIGTKYPDFLLEVNGSAGKPDGGSWSNSSDERLKNITGEYQEGLNAVIRLRPIRFHYKEGNPRGLPIDEEYIGFIAQEVQEVFPEAVNEGPDGYLDFNMHPVNVALVNAIKELKAENEIIKAENMAMREDIARIKAALGM